MSLSDSILDNLRVRGERITIPRRLVIEALCSTGDHHRSIQTIQHFIQQRQPELAVSDTTIYRILQWLKDLEIVCQTDLGKSGMVYALIVKPYHHHLICLTCGAMITLDDAIFTPLRQQLRDDYAFEARIDHMAIYGQCEKCAHSAL